jgi:hypothetical protein
VTPEVLLIATPSVNFDTFPSACRQVLGYSPLRAASTTSRELSEVEKFLSCLANFRDEKAVQHPSPHLFSHVACSVFVVADERDLRDILECCSGMAFVTADTLARNVTAAVVSGTLAQWRDAVASGCVPQVEPSVRAGFNKIYALFRSVGLNAWSDYRAREAPDNNTLLLEHKPQR